MSPHQSARSVPRAGEMPGSAAQTDARTRSRKRTRDTSSRPGCSRRIHVAIVRVTTRTTHPSPYSEPVYTGGTRQGPAR
jgi:hypothetical protein